VAATAGEVGRTPDVVPSTDAPAETVAAETSAPTAPPADTTAAETEVSTRTWSRLTCKEIGSELEQVPGTCGFSKIQKACYVNTQFTYDTARSTCESVGGRLCTLAEIVGGVQLNSGCSSGAKKFVWTQDACEGGHMIAQGASRYQVKFGPQCVASGPTDKFAVVRCCADTAPAPAATAGPSNPGVGSPDTTAAPAAATTTEAPAAPPDLAVACSCTQTRSAVCGYNGKTYHNPCYAFCDSQFAFMPGECKVGRSESCAPQVLGHFTYSAQARLKQTSKATIKKFKGVTATECASACLDVDENLCHAFEYHERNKRCELKVRDPSEIQTKKNANWKVYMRTGYCAYQTQARGQQGRLIQSTDQQRQMRPIPTDP